MLRLFCGTLRYERPFKQDEFTYATDAFKAIRIPLSIFDSPYITPAKDMPKIAGVYDVKKEEKTKDFTLSIPDLLGAIALHDMYLDANTRCRECSGTGTGECPHCEQDMECEDCGGTGKSGEEKTMRQIKFNVDKILVEDIPFTTAYLHNIVLAALVNGDKALHFEVYGQKVMFRLSEGVEMLLMTQAY